MKLIIIVWMLCNWQGIHAQQLNTMETRTNNKEAVKAVIEQYLKGIQFGDTALLAQTFHKDALLFGDINGEPYAKTRNEYLSGVANRVSPNDSDEAFEATIGSIDVINSIAIAKLNVKMYTFNYYNFLTLHEIDGKWLIVSKTLTNVKD
jgi:hypothetical protein